MLIDIFDFNFYNNIHNFLCFIYKQRYAKKDNGIQILFLVERSVWEQLIGLYPCLVECTIATASGQVSRSLREALLQYHDLLRPPLHSSTTSNGV